MIVFKPAFSQLSYIFILFYQTMIFLSPIKSPSHQTVIISLADAVLYNVNLRKSRMVIFNRDTKFNKYHSNNLRLILIFPSLNIIFSPPHFFLTQSQLHVSWWQVKRRQAAWDTAWRQTHPQRSCNASKQNNALEKISWCFFKTSN